MPKKYTTGRTQTTYELRRNATHQHNHQRVLARPARQPEPMEALSAAMRTGDPQKWVDFITSYINRLSKALGLKPWQSKLFLGVCVTLLISAGVFILVNRRTGSADASSQSNRHHSNHTGDSSSVIEHGSSVYDGAPSGPIASMTYYHDSAVAIPSHSPEVVWEKIQAAISEGLKNFLTMPGASAESDIPKSTEHDDKSHLQQSHVNRRANRKAKHAARLTDPLPRVETTPTNVDNDAFVDSFQQQMSLPPEDRNTTYLVNTTNPPLFNMEQFAIDFGYPATEITKELTVVTINDANFTRMAGTPATYVKMTYMYLSEVSVNELVISNSSLSYVSFITPSMDSFTLSYSNLSTVTLNAGSNSVTDLRVDECTGNINIIAGTVSEAYISGQYTSGNIDTNIENSTIIGSFEETSFGSELIVNTTFNGYFLDPYFTWGDDTGGMITASKFIGDFLYATIGGAARVAVRDCLFNGTFTASNFNSLQFEASRLYGSYQETVFYYSSIENSDLNGVFGAAIGDAMLRSTTLSGDFSGSIFDSSVLSQLHLVNIANFNFAGAYVTDLQVEGELGNVNFGNGIYDGFLSGDFSNRVFPVSSEFRNITLLGNFTGTNISSTINGMNAEGVDLRYTRFPGATLGETIRGNFYRVSLDGVVVPDQLTLIGNFSRSDWFNANINNLNATQANMYRAHFDNAAINGEIRGAFPFATFTDATLTNVNAAGISLVGTNLSQAKVISSNLANVQLDPNHPLVLNGASIQQSNWRGANCPPATNTSGAPIASFPCGFFYRPVPATRCLQWDASTQFSHNIDMPCEPEHTKIISFAVGGGVLGLVFLGGIVFLCQRYRSAQNRTSTDEEQSLVVNDDARTSLAYGAT